MSDLVTVDIDTRNLSKGISASMAYTSRTMPQVVNTSAYWIAINAKQGLPFVTAQKVDAELSVITRPVIGKRGKPTKKKRLAGRANSYVTGSSVPLSVLILQARMDPRSRYNKLTNQRYALPSLRGMSKSGRDAAMRALEHKMIAARHSSGKFLIAGWIPAVRRLREFAVTKFLKGQVSGLADQKSARGQDKGGATPAVGGALGVFAEIENDIGMEGKNSANFNRALLTYGAPALQSAVDREGKRSMDYALNKMGQEMKSLVEKFWK